MDDFCVQLPSIEWFIAGNVYSGSIGTHPQQGALSVTIFHYRVQALCRSHAWQLIASCWSALPWSAPELVQEIMIGRFEASAYGVEAAQNWIRSKILLTGGHTPCLSASGLPCLPAKGG